MKRETFVLNIVINFIEYQPPEGNQQNMQSNIQTTQNSFLNLIQSQINNARISSANMGVAREAGNFIFNILLANIKATFKK